MFRFKMPGETAYLELAEMLFQSFAPLKEKDLLPFLMIVW